MVNTNTKTIGIATSAAIGLAILLYVLIQHPETTDNPGEIICSPNQELVDGVCNQIEEGEKIDYEITNENVIGMRVLRVDTLLNTLNNLNDDDFIDPIKGRNSYTKSLNLIKKDTENESVVTAINKMYNLQKQFDGVGSDELISNEDSRMQIYSVISDILHSQYKSLTTSSYASFPNMSKPPKLPNPPIPSIETTVPDSIEIPEPIENRISTTTVTINPALGSGAPGCEETVEGCFIPKEVTVNVDGKVIFSNTDTAAHTFTAGTPGEGPSGVFDSSLVIAGSSYEWTPTSAGEFPFYCMVHPWMTGNIQVN